ncbi:hypothetical protein F2P81_019826 [Scophthalmus maximus]|uniref:Uncharacterized protein n=1 Tax=Scophthalmus maximus TaxID=52904 RepID=A0A6A4S4B6_SCOMX|nr:hypothetical protein F2P81_019826 [Scophthalmus maximus]
MIKDKKPPPATAISFKQMEGNEEHNYATPMEVASASNKRDRGDVTPANTPEKVQTEKKAKGMSVEEVNTSMENILQAIDGLGKRLDDRMEDISSQMQQHSTMLASIAKMVQVNSEQLKECETRIRSKKNSWKI